MAYFQGEDGTIIVYTNFSEIYQRFLSYVTDDMYMELNMLDTYRLLQELLVNAIPYFEFPRQNLLDYELCEVIDDKEYVGEDSNYKLAKIFITNDDSHFNCKLTNEEQNILAKYMVVEWIGQQLATIENTRMKYSGSDFKFTSQANHLSKLISMKKQYLEEGLHLQRLYKRRKVDNKGNIVSTMSELAEVNNRDN